MRRTLTPALSLTLLIAGCSEPPPPSLVVIVLDTVRADALGAELNGRPVTPELDRLWSESVSVEQAYAPAPWTVPSHATLFTGLHPHEHRAQHERFALELGFTTLAERLAETGHATGGFSCNPWINAQTGFSQGFQVFKEVYKWGVHEREKGGAEATRQALTWVETVVDSDRPFFLFVNYLEAHLPYEPPLDVMERFEVATDGSSVSVDDAKRFNLDPDGSALDLDEARRLYLAEVAYVDELVGRLVDGLSEITPLDDVMIVLVSDHGEHLGEHALVGHEFSLYEPVLRIPMAIRFPSACPPNTRISEPFGLVDLMPSLLDLLHLDFDARELSGVSRARRLSGRQVTPLSDPVFAEYARPRTLVERHWSPPPPREQVERFDHALWSVRIGSEKLIRDDRGWEQLFDVVADPLETRDLSRDRPESLAELRTHLAAFDDAATSVTAGGEPPVTR